MKSGRGGKREGAGRPVVPEGQKKELPGHSIRCTQEEFDLLKAYLKQLRSGKVEIK